MDDLDKLIKTTLGEVEKVLNSKTVVGEPIQIGDTTLIPLLSVGFGFGAGGGSSKGDEKQPGHGSGSATGGGAGVRPIAVIVIDKDGTRIEPIKGAMAAALEKLTDSVPGVVEKVTEKLGGKKKEEEK
ncbi:MAG: sporulation protein YtfJ [Chloroflexi bacterium]|nr:sporulation protein YtfJ [Chloroflexota bacterium]MBM3153965.1 sporulation protein YtfJ [Chloroflexota bacterium]MBM3172814.1 sporulation protein YtfJ [Chloroflexota bacterium]MBM3175741.1 sporulation protein YtfJ [Chloroflexota bacterium]MBM4450463.1 sporulation protein YtfJ [Chloroflexota bacterium]